MKQKPQLFLLPFGGGNYYSYQFMLPHLNDFEVMPLELPGRGNRMNEELLKNYDTAVTDIYKQIKAQRKNVPYLIYGHSLGAYLALGATHLLEKDATPPVYLILTGNPGPNARESKNRHLFGPEEFINELRRLGGIPEEVLENKELFAFFEPVLRADFELADANSSEKRKIVNTDRKSVV